LDAQYQDHRGNFDVIMTDGPFRQTQIAGEAVLQDGQQITLQTLRLQRDDWRWENTKPVAIVHDSNGMTRLDDLHLRNGDQELRVQGHLQPDGPLAAKVRVQGVQLQPTVRALAPETKVPDGRLHVDLNLSGTQSRPEMDGTLRLEALQWQEQTVGTIEATVQLQDDILRHNIHFRDGPTELMQSQGTIGLGNSGELAINVQSNDFDLARLKPFSDQIQDMAGALHLDLRLAGTLAEPEAYGDLVLEQGALQLETTGEPYKDIQSRIHFEGQRVHIENLHVGSSRGDLELQGALQLAGLALEKLDMTLDAKEFTAMNTPGIEAAVTADIEASGSQQALTVNGNVTVPRARIRIDELPGTGPSAVKPEDLTVDAVYGSGAKESGASETNGSVATQRDPLPFLQADLKIDLPRNVWLQARGTAIELKGDLEVTKPYNHPLVIGGDVETLRGHATFFGRKFDLQTGVITFTGSEDINPTLDITASYRVSEYTVNVNVTGESKAPSLTLSSEPELEQQDIIALLLFGKTSDRLTESEGTISEQAQAAAANAAAGAAAQAIGRELGIDSLDVKAGNTPDDASISAGQYITQDLFLSYERQFGKEGGNTVGVEYNLSQELLLKGSSSDLGESALDLLWRRDY
jgi:translocation and assembly module TamB